MSSLKHTDRIILEKLFEMDSGYVCDFSDRTFRDFILENTGIDVYTERFAINGTSKANRLRTFWKIENDKTVSKLIKNMLEYWRVTKITSNSKFEHSHEYLYKEGNRIANELRREVPSKPSVRDTSSVDVKDKDHDFWEFKPSWFGFTIDFKKLFKKLIKRFGKEKQKPTNQSKRNVPTTYNALISTLLITVIGGVFVYIITEGEIPKMFKNTKSPVAISTKQDDISDLRNFLAGYDSIFDFVAKIHSLDLDIDRKDLVDANRSKSFMATSTMLELGKFESGNLWVTMQGLDSNGNNQAMECHFDESWENTLRSLFDTEKRQINFKGKIDFYKQYWLVAEDCEVIDY